MLVPRRPLIRLRLIFLENTQLCVFSLALSPGSLSQLFNVVRKEGGGPGDEARLNTHNFVCDIKSWERGSGGEAKVHPFCT